MFCPGRVGGMRLSRKGFELFVGSVGRPCVSLMTLTIGGQRLLCGSVCSVAPCLEGSLQMCTRLGIHHGEIAWTENGGRSSVRQNQQLHPE